MARRPAWLEHTEEKGKGSEGQITQVLRNHFRDFDSDAEGTGKSHWGVSELSRNMAWHTVQRITVAVGEEWIVGGQGKAGRIVRRLLK